MRHVGAVRRPLRRGAGRGAAARAGGDGGAHAARKREYRRESATATASRPAGGVQLRTAVGRQHHSYRSARSGSGQACCSIAAAVMPATLVFSAMPVPTTRTLAHLRQGAKQLARSTTASPRPPSTEAKTQDDESLKRGDCSLRDIVRRARRALRAKASEEFCANFWLSCSWVDEHRCESYDRLSLADEARRHREEA